MTHTIVLLSHTCHVLVPGDADVLALHHEVAHGNKQHPHTLPPEQLSHSEHGGIHHVQLDTAQPVAGAGSKCRRHTHAHKRDCVQDAAVAAKL